MHTVFAMLPTTRSPGNSAAGCIRLHCRVGRIGYAGLRVWKLPGEPTNHFGTALSERMLPVHLAGVAESEKLLKP